MSPDEWQLALSSLWPIALGALFGTIPLALLSFTAGMPIAIAIVLMRLSQRAVVSRLGGALVYGVRRTPLLVQLFVTVYELR